MHPHKQRNSHIHTHVLANVKICKFAAFRGVCPGFVARLRLRASVEAKVVAHAQHQGEGTFHQVDDDDDDDDDDDGDDAQHQGEGTFHKVKNL